MYFNYAPIACKVSIYYYFYWCIQFWFSDLWWAIFVILQINITLYLSLNLHLDLPLPPIAHCHNCHLSDKVAKWPKNKFWLVLSLFTLPPSFHPGPGLFQLCLSFAPLGPPGSFGWTPRGGGLPDLSCGAGLPESSTRHQPEVRHGKL